MKNKRKWLLLINFITLFSLLTATVIQLSSGLTEIFAAPNEISLSSEDDLTSLQAGDDFVVKISDSRVEGDIATTENTEVPYVDMSGDITDAATASGSSSVTRQWAMALPEGISFDEASETAMLKEADANAALPTFSYDEETRVLDITVGVSVTELDLKFYADTAGSYELSVADKNIMLTDSNKLAVVISEVATEDTAIADVTTPLAATTDNDTADATATEFGRTTRGFTTATPDELNDYNNEITYYQWGGTNNTWGDEPTDTSQIIYVNSISKLTKALKGSFTNADGNDEDGVPYVNKNNASYIKFTANIDNGNRVSAIGSRYEILPAEQRSVVIDGNGFYLSTGQYYYRWGYGYYGDAWENSRYAISVYIKNMDMYSQNPYGCFSNWFNRYSSFIYEDITYTGAQLSASYRSTQVFRGTNVINNGRGFNHPTDGAWVESFIGAYGVYASGLEGRRAYIQNGSNTTFNAAVGDGVILGAYMSPDVSNNVPLLHVESNATFNVNATGNGGESFTAPDYGSTNGGVYAGVSIYNGGKLTMANTADTTQKAIMNVDVSNTGRAGVRLTGGSPSRYTTVDIGENSKLNVVTNGQMGIRARGFFTSGETQYQYYAGLSMYNYSRINLAATGAELNIDMQNDNYMWSTNGNGSFSPGIYMAANSSIDIAGGATFNLNMNGSFGSALRMEGAGSTFNVSADGTANFIASNQVGPAYQGTTGAITQIGTSDYNAWSELVYVNTGNFTIGRSGTFVMRVEDGAGWRSMLYANTGRFTFSDAKRIDIDAQANDNAQLINMNGTFVADIQIVYAWNKGNTGKDPTTNRDFYWAPIYNANVSYTRGSTLTSTVNSVNSIEDGIAESFSNSYRTESFNRILYEQVPDVDVSIDDVSDNEAELNGQQVSGTVNPDSFAAIYLTRRGTTTVEALSPLTETGQVDVNGDMVYYNATSDNNGDYSLTIPSGTILYVGDIITVRGFRWGKEDTQTFVVLDQTAPEATTRIYYTYLNDPTVPTASSFITGITDKGVDDTTGYPITFNSATDIDTLVQTATDENGVDVSIDIADLAVATDGSPAPNSRTITAKLVVAANPTGMTVSSPLEIEYSEVRNMADDAALETYILNNVTLMAYQITGGVRQEWTAATDFTVTDLGNLAGRTGLAMDTDYPVVIAPASTTGLTGLSATTIVNIINMNASLVIEFRSDGGTLLDTITVGQDDTYDIQADVLVGDNINLTADPYQAVATQKAALIAAGYASVSLPAGVDETAVAITADGQIITYTANGQLIIQSRPTEINFGSLTFNGQAQRVENPTTNNDLVIADTRSDTTKGWVLKLALTERMYSQSTNSYMNDAIRYKMAVDTDDVILTDQAVEVYSEATGGTGLFNVTDTWGTTDGSVGLKLVADPGNTTNSDIGDYTGEITWTIESAP